MMVFVAACQTGGDADVAGETQGAANEASFSSETGPATSRAASAREKLLSQEKFDPTALAQASIATDKRYFIDFRSRYALSYGHTFVVFGRVDSRGQEVGVEVSGLAPASDDPAVYAAGHWVPVKSSTGWTDGDSEFEYMTAIWRVMLTKSEYDKVVADIRELQESKTHWHAVVYNCNAYLGDIASSMGYRAPNQWLMPRDYITRLRKMNGGKDAIGWTAPSARTPPGFS